MENEQMIINEIETTTCTRCCGTGQYSWCSAHGSRCFKCGGSGKALTKRGAATNAFIKSLRSTETIVSELKVGDYVKPAGENKFRKILSISEPSQNSSYKDFEASAKAGHDVWVPITAVTIAFDGAKYSVRQSIGSTMLRHNNLDDLATWKIGMEFQATLSKTGKATKKTSAEGIAFLAAQKK
jgi:DnaJ-class molecular chaperone